MLKLESQLVGQTVTCLYVTIIDDFRLAEVDGHDFTFGNGKLDSDWIFETSDGYVTN